MKIIRKFKYYKFLYSPSKKTIDLLPNIQSDLILITIAYNNPEFILLQISLLKENFKDNFFHCIIDNSSNPGVREEIYKICKEERVSYYEAPKNHYINNKSHAAAMHWAYFQVIRKYKFDYFGFLDHDIFPISSFSLNRRIKQGIYGRVVNSYFKDGYQEEISNSIPYWSIWAGYCFFKSSFFKLKFPWDFNFFSKHFPDGYFLDTGGGLWDLIYSKLNYPGTLASYRKVKLLGNLSAGDQNDGFEIFDETWIHFVSLSNWREIKDLKGKKEILTRILSKARNEGIDFTNKPI